MRADFSQIGPFLLAALVVFVIYRRLRRSFGQQLLSPVRMQIRIVVLLIVGCLLLPVTLRSSALAASVSGGMACGVALALWGAARTRYLRIEGRLYYVPHTYTGIAVSLLFVGRLAYRLLQAYGATHTGNVSGLNATDQAFAPAAMVRSPLTVALFFVLLGYYVCYYSVVLWKSKRVSPETIDPAPAAPIT
jgi:hypothetical protein